MCTGVGQTKLFKVRSSEKVPGRNENKADITNFNTFHSRALNYNIY